MIQNSPQMSFWPVQGDVFGQAHWTHIQYELQSSCGKLRSFSGTLDQSTGFIYRFEDREVIRMKALWGAVYTPIYLIEVIAYHLIRGILVTLYFCGKVVEEYAYSHTSSSLSQIALERCKELGREWKRSLVNIVRAPFYALAFFFGALYALIDPYNGRKVLAAYEYAWNHSIPLSQSIHLFVPKKEWTFHLMGEENAYYVHGCSQPVACMKPQCKEIFKPYSETAWNNSEITGTPQRAAFFCCFV